MKINTLHGIFHSPHSSRGFTLIEVLLSLAIFTIIGIATARHLQQLSNTKKQAFDQIDLYNGARTAISLMRFDISQSFHILYDDLGSENKQSLLQNINVPHTLFDGRKNQLVFTSLSHRVYYENRRECEQTEISYFLQDQKDSKFSRLLKRESRIIDADLFEGGKVYTILDNVAELTFKYWDDKNGKWIDDWSSDDQRHLDRFPFSVSVRLVVADKKGAEIPIETQFKIAFPNNEPFLVKF